MEQQSDSVHFGDFQLDLADRQLRRGGTPVDLGSRYFDALALLVANAGSLVSKTRFMDEVWRGIPVTDEALTQCIRTLRRALGDDAGNPRYIQTVPKHGYRFLAEVAVEDAPDSAAHKSSIAGRVAGACTLSGALAGVLGGAFYGALAGTGGGATIVVLAALVGALGTLAGAAIGLGMAAAIAWRGRADPAVIAGAVTGGVVAGALGSTLGRDGIGLLTGEALGRVTGIYEGLVLGAAAGLAGWLVLRDEASSAPRLAPVAMVLGLMAGILVDIGGGRLLGGSLYALQRSLGDTQLRLESIGTLFGESTFGPTAHLASATGEGAVFVLAIATGLLVLKRR